MSGDVLSQQTHRRALVGVPWQPALGRECPDWLPATTWPAGTQRKEGSRRPSPTSSSCSQSGGLEAVLPGPMCW